MICLLSEGELRSLREFGLEPNCDNHRHESKMRADQIESDQGGQWIHLPEEKRPRFIVFRPRIWKIRNMAMQLVPGVIEGRKGSFRYPIKSIGGRERNTSVSKNNYEPIPATT